MTGEERAGGVGAHGLGVGEVGLAEAGLVALGLGPRRLLEVGDVQRVRAGEGRLGRVIGPLHGVDVCHVAGQRDGPFGRRLG